MRKLKYRIIRYGCIVASTALVSLVGLTAYCYQQLPDAALLEEVQLQVPLRIFTQNGELMAEYGEKRRVPIAIESIPKDLILAIVATEDRRFYEHPGVDARGLARAIVHFARNGKKEQGGSTITMQVARNFFLTRQKTFTRKLNEILLALKIDRELSKETILELYLNKIYFGKNSYGVAAAAQVYYGKSVDKLTLAQMAMLAGLPQAPSAINPLNNAPAAKLRRNHVLSRMHHYGFITDEAYAEAITAPLTASHHGRGIELSAPYVAESIRQELLAKYGDQIYSNGFVVYSTINKSAQQVAVEAIQKAILEYDERHGYRGPVKRLALAEAGPTIPSWLASLPSIPSYPHLSPGVVVEVNPTEAFVLRPSGEFISLSLESIQWARPIRRTGALGPAPTSVEEVLGIGDVIYLSTTSTGWRLSQVPEIGAALVAMNPDSGAIVALMGGYDFPLSHFNRATQASRQPGSAFKPFIYAAALEQGYTPASIINDSPVVYDDPALEDTWRPQNDTRQFYGPTRLREGIVHSRNLVSIRLLQSIGLSAARRTLVRLGFKENSLPNGLSLALGTTHSTPVEMAAAYSIFANGGFQVEPHLIHHVEDIEGNILFAQDPPLACYDCEENVWPEIKPAKRVLSSQISYIVTDLLQDAITRGTGKRANALGRHDLSGKTGTTNNLQDNWFAGYNRDWVCITWMGFDDPSSIREYASQTTLPLWMNFMGGVLKGAPESTLPQPPGLMQVRIDPESGLLAYPKQKDAIFELFRAENVPTLQANMLPPAQNTTLQQSASLF